MAGTLTISVVKNDTTSPPAFQNSAGTEVGQLSRAWVNFNGVTTATIRASFNVSSVTRNSTGDYTVNFTNAFADTNFAVALGGKVLIDNSDTVARTTTAVAVRAFNPGATGSSPSDHQFLSVCVFR